MDEEYYTVEEVAKMFRVSPRTIRNLIRDGELRAIQIGSQYRIPVAAVEEMKRQPGKAKAALAGANY